MPRTTPLPTLILLTALLGFVACAERAGRTLAAAAAPLTLEGSAYELAGEVLLPEAAPRDGAGLHNVFALSEQIISGGEPDGEEAIAAIAAMGVKTILSVDGKAPDAATAARYGLSYVHVPIQYRGMAADELLAIAKTFREQPGPFYVHCFHGKHRGPAAAAVGRLVRDGVPRDQAVAEMRQWCGTSPKYEGLYRQIAAGDMPDAAQTAAFAFDFPSAHEPDGMRQLMVGLARAFDNVAAMADNGWTPPVDHPDIDPANEAAILAGLMERGATLDAFERGDPALSAGLSTSLSASHSLREAVLAAREQGDWQPAEQAYRALKASCNDCHSAFRND
ncbi:MAG: hypothetical protein DRQ55_05110 [Planctomycetota bacterium]|nr:MAG: hypothetical protein DRQ55_05110 [Planctomycetota bacterium]